MKKIIMSSILATLALATSNEIYAGGGNNVVSCCNVVGNNSMLVGPCTCYAGASMGGRARGDVVTLDLAGITAKTLLAKKGTIGLITVPEAGAMNLYQFGDIRIVFASFYLQNQDLNPKVSPALQKIITAAAQKNTWAKTMIWVGRALPRETTFTEVQETYTDMEDLAEAAKISYEVINPKTVTFTIPASKNTKEQSITVDFTPIKK